MSADPKHTPGPWHAGPNGVIRATRVHEGGGRETRWIAEIIECLPPVAGEREANARLIAAAPDLYDVVQSAPILSKYHGHRGFEVERFITDYEAWCDAKYAALAKVSP